MKRNINLFIKLLLIIIFPIFLTLTIMKSNHMPYEFIDKNTHSMVAPAINHPYLPKLFSDLLNNLQIPWHNFCVRNNSYSNEHNMPFDLAIKLENEVDFTKIHYKDIKCYSVLNNDIKYDVAWGGFVIPDKNWVKQNFDCSNGQCSLKFKIEEMISFEVYSEFSLFMVLTIYLIFVSSMAAISQTFIFVWNFIFGKNDSINGNKI